MANNIILGLLELMHCKLYLFEDKAVQGGFHLVDEIDTRAILDMKWSLSSLVMVLS